MAAVAQVLRRGGQVHEWMSFAFQVAIAVFFEVFDDLARGLVSQHGTMEGVANARKIASFEAAHGFWIEPAWQMFFLHTRHVLALTLDWTVIARGMNGIYVLGHVFVTLGVAIWVYRFRRRYFRLLRNAIICVNLFALLLYEDFPVAPPRMTTGLTFNHHPFAFVDTLFGVATNTGKAVGGQVGYNEFSAMPSVHVAWALIAGAALVFLARRFLPRVLGAVYPIAMLVAVVVTGNHYLLDAVAAVGIVALAILVSFGFEWWRRTLPRPWERQESSSGALA